MPAEAVREQVSLVRDQQPVTIGGSQYPRPYHNDQHFFPPSNSYKEFPLDGSSMYLIAITIRYPESLKPGPVRVIYDDTTGEIMGLIAHPSRHCRTFTLATRREYRPRWYWAKGLKEWVFNGTGGHLVRFAPKRALLSLFFCPLLFTTFIPLSPPQRALSTRHRNRLPAPPIWVCPQ